MSTIQSILNPAPKTTKKSAAQTTESTDSTPKKPTKLELETSTASADSAPKLDADTVQNNLDETPKDATTDVKTTVIGAESTADKEPKKAAESPSEVDPKAENIAALQSKLASQQARKTTKSTGAQAAES